MQYLIELCMWIGENIPLVDGRFVADLAKTTEPGAIPARTAVQSAREGQMKELHVFAYEALMEHARANGYDPEQAKTRALWAEFDLMQEHWMRVWQPPAMD